MQVAAHDKPDADGRFIDDTWLNGDPVWVVYRGPAEVWFATSKPQSVYEYAHGAKIAVCGDEPHLYGYRFVERSQMFQSLEAAENECTRRNAPAAS